MQTDMKFEELANLIQENCPEILRTCWKPVIADELSRNQLSTKFGGSNPFRGTNFSWPRCGLEKCKNLKEECDVIELAGVPESGQECGKQKLFICQINLSELPDQAETRIGKNSGLFQFFCCTFHDYSKGEDTNIHFIPKSEMIPSLQTLAAIAVYETKTSREILPKDMQIFVEKTNEEFDFEELERDEQVQVKEKQVETWEESKVREIPQKCKITDNDKISRKIMALPGIDEDVLYDVEFEYNDGMNTTPIGTPFYGTKLAGYVAWFDRYVDYSTCSDCKLAMDVTFLQLVCMQDTLVRSGTRSTIPSLDWDVEAASITLCPGCGKPGMTYHLMF